MHVTQAPRRLGHKVHLRRAGSRGSPVLAGLVRRQPWQPVSVRRACVLRGRPALGSVRCAGGTAHVNTARSRAHPRGHVWPARQKAARTPHALDLHPHRRRAVCSLCGRHVAATTPAEKVGWAAAPPCQPLAPTPPATLQQHATTRCVPLRAATAGITLSSPRSTSTREQVPYGCVRPPCVCVQDRAWALVIAARCWLVAVWWWWR